MSTTLDYTVTSEAPDTEEVVMDSGEIILGDPVLDPDPGILIEPLPPADGSVEGEPLIGGLTEPGVGDEWMGGDIVTWDWIDDGSMEPLEYTEDMIFWATPLPEGEVTDGWSGDADWGDESWVEDGYWGEDEYWIEDGYVGEDEYWIEDGYVGEDEYWIEDGYWGEDESWVGDGEPGFADIPYLWCHLPIWDWPTDGDLEGDTLAWTSVVGDAMDAESDGMPLIRCGTEVPIGEPIPGEEMGGESGLVDPIEVVDAVDGGEVEVLPILWCGTTTDMQVDEVNVLQMARDLSPAEPDGTLYIDEMPTILDDVISGTSGSDRLVGNRRANGIDGGDGNDTLLGHGGADILSGDAGNDLLHGGQGNDRLLGGSGRDTLKGNDGIDNLQGGDGDDLLHGGAQQDFLRGDRGNDTLIGGEDTDVFILQPGLGADLIVDFQDGVDKLGFLVGDLTADQLSFRQMGQNTVVQMDKMVLAVLQGVQASALSIDDVAPVMVVV